MKRNAFTLIEFVVVVAIIAILAAILLPVFQRPVHDNRGSICQSNLKQITLSFLQYSQDYDERMPPVALAKSGYWAGSLQPYVKSWQLFQCPSAGRNAPKTTDYFYNSRLAKVEMKFLNSPNQTIIAGDGRDNSPTSYAISELPKNWRSAAQSPALRHHRGEGANYAFADGHVKYLNPQKIKETAPAKDIFTFALR